MAKPTRPEIVTANDLLMGDAVYLTENGGWSRWHGDAHVARDAAEARQMLRQAEAQAAKVVGPYLAGAELDADGRPVPVHFREAFRSRGPSNYPHGKQEDGAARA
ncbi:hypothetical protein RGUI_4275 (plasmid) [Rhodovulum sp. P5]|uniref:DUF2849 domain-containing protein n=1 Tax=Rhodovulum sp. P5 TaxID=1564506 RepID=UPI0009C21FD9|nr:DUF2849 domain-containing protein [Rhodovulum sp. P5]ARE42301.1 hypothetical protein RGUI_4275 [Rhodovulum sp. P5]